MILNDSPWPDLTFVLQIWIGLLDFIPQYDRTTVKI